MEYFGNRGAGVLPVSRESRKCLIALRSDWVMEPRTWGIWGGKIDDGEVSPKDAALRELFEETGYTGNVSLYEAYVYKDKNFQYYNFFGLVDSEFEPDLNWETSDYRWFSFDELMDLEPKHFGLRALLNDKKSLDLLKKLTKKSDF